MQIGTMKTVFGWCAIINIVFLLWWFLMIVFAHDLVYKWHTKWFKLSVETFDTIHYAGIAFYKILMFIFTIVPYFALRVVG